ncbi:MAG: undecaprenyl-phosphate glucose phosphotransferase [Clostridia bacterium]|nr:undecaprenyl-phosphate glucose phosphotransferase [Clostridia bacterium]
MIKKNQSILNAINVISDFVILWIACIIAWNIRYVVLDGILSLDLTAGEIIVYAALFAALNTGVLFLFRLYAPQRLKMAGSNTVRIFAACGGCVLILMAAMFVFRQIDMSRLAIVIGWLMCSVLISLKHIILHALLHVLRSKGRNLKHFIVVGNGSSAAGYLKDVEENFFCGIRVDGYVSASVRPEMGVCLGSYEQLAEILEKGAYDGIVVALESHETKFLPMILAAADKEGTYVEMIPFFNDYYPKHPTIGVIGNTRLVDLRATPLDDPSNALLKRSTDILISVFALIALSPLMLIIAAGVKISSPGPVIFKQERMGRGKKLFNMYKFRSMRVTGSESTGWSTDGDPRKTKFGSFIRKFSLDELPQFFNVLRGDMSVVGPRPEIPYHIDHFKNEIPRYLVRQQVRPGITGLAQVNGYRGDTSITERVKLDLEYIDDWSPELDLRIMWSTVFGGMINSEVVIRESKHAKGRTDDDV